MPWRRRPVVTSLEEHPNRPEIMSILARVPELSDRDVARLAGGWRDTAYLASARDHALCPDSPLVLDVLNAFDLVDEIFDEELSGSAVYDSSPGGESFATALKPQVVNVALKAVRDAIAAAYARPVLSRAEYVGLLTPWRQVFPAPAEGGSLPGPRSAS